MSPRRASLVAAALTVLVFLGIAWVASGIEIPADAPTAHTPWMRPFRVVAALGFWIASMLHVPHVAGQLIAAILLGAVLGAVFAISRHLVP